MAGVPARSARLIPVADLGLLRVPQPLQEVVVALVFGCGTTVLVAHARGARDPGGMRAAVRDGRALWALWALSAVAVGGFLLREPLARLRWWPDAGAVWAVGC
ncbi:hypothetical protein ACFXKY_37785 [Streptomyces canus]|uniref:hypothetical protein n=1 Tax=Streptomyces canus TaxID=58343 RepID=UPI0036818C9C